VNVCFCIVSAVLTRESRQTRGPGGHIHAADEEGMDLLDVTRIEPFEKRHKLAGDKLLTDTECTHSGDTDPGQCELTQRLAVGCLDAPAHGRGDLLAIAAGCSARPA
jgi:microcompartment protein CcmK/EutM